MRVRMRDMVQPRKMRDRTVPCLPSHDDASASAALLSAPTAASSPAGLVRGRTARVGAVAVRVGIVVIVVPAAEADGALDARRGAGVEGRAGSVVELGVYRG